MAIITRSIHNLSSTQTLTIFVPGYNPSVGPISLSPTVTLDLLTIVTEDELEAMQLALNQMVSEGLISVAATVDTAQFEIGYTGAGGSVGAGTQYQLTYYGTTGTAVSGLTSITGNRAIVTNSNGLPIASSTTDTEISYVHGVTSAIQTQLGDKLDLVGGTMTGNIIMSDGMTITGIPTPGSGPDAANKDYADTKLSLIGGTVTGPVGIGESPIPTAELDVASSTLGFLPPRMTADQMNAIAVTATPSGVIVYGTPSVGDTITVTTPDDGVVTYTEGTDFSTITQLVVLLDGLTDISASNDATTITVASQISGPTMNSATIIGTGSYSALDITFSGGAGPTEGLFIYNLDDHHYYGFDGSIWQKVAYISDIGA